MLDIKHINLLKYDEISVKGLANDVLQDEEMKFYFPDFKEGSGVTA
jgi:hypothetical protein